MTEQGAEYVLTWYVELERRLLDFLDRIPFTDSNQGVVLPLLAPLVVEAGSLIDTVFREEHPDSLKPKRKLDIGDFALEYECRLGLSTARSLLYQFPSRLLSPFANWTSPESGNYTQLIWWTGQNRIKHNRIEQANLATLDLTVTILCALHQVIAKIPVFIGPLWRRNMIKSNVNTHYISQRIEDTNIGFDASVETELFITPIGVHSFPNAVDEITPFFHHSDRLARFLGRY